jgi:hypothetical protein
VQVSEACLNFGSKAHLCLKQAHTCGGSGCGQVMRDRMTSQNIHAVVFALVQRSPVRTKYEDNNNTPKYINRKSKNYKRIRIISIDSNKAIQHTKNLYKEYAIHSPRCHPEYCVKGGKRTS